MNNKKGRPSEFNTESDYETTVLDFLEKEMAGAQPAEKKDLQSDELNALVSDMLKQVITESDSPQSLNELVYDKEDDLFDGLTPNLTIASKPVIDRPTSLPAATPTKPAGPDDVAVGQDTPINSGTVFSIPKPLLASESLSNAKKPLVTSAVLVCIVVVFGTVGYFFFRSSSKTPATLKSPPAAEDQLIKSPTKEVSAHIIQPSKNDLPVPAVATKPNPVPAAPDSKQPDNSRQSSIQQSVKPSSPPKEKPEDAPAKVANTPSPVKEEKPAVAPPPPQEPTPIPVAAAVEKPAVAAVPDSPPAAAPEKKPATQPPAPSASAAQSPSEPRILVAAVPISQASPAYPELALRSHASGSVVLELQIDEQGKVTRATAVSGPAIFYNAAAAAAMKWRYKPASIGGVNVSSVGKVTMDFNLKK